MKSGRKLYTATGGSRGVSHRGMYAPGDRHNVKTLMATCDYSQNTEARCVKHKTHWWVQRAPHTSSRDIRHRILHFRDPGRIAPSDPSNMARSPRNTPILGWGDSLFESFRPSQTPTFEKRPVAPRFSRLAPPPPPGRGGAGNRVARTHPTNSCRALRRRRTEQARPISARNWIMGG